MNLIALVPILFLWNLNTDREAQFAQDLERFIQTSLTELRTVPGVSVAFVKDGRTLHCDGLGWLDVAQKTPSSPKAYYYIASSTKTFTALAVLLLHHQGRLNLDESLADYFPEMDFPAALKADQVSLVDLLTHTAGLDNEPLQTRLAYTGEHTLQVRLDLLKATQADKDKGLGQFSYTNLGYNIAALILQKRFGKSWQEVVAEEVLKPLGMTATTARVSQLPEAQRARPHRETGTAAERMAYEKDDSMLHAAGGLYATAEDMARWLHVQTDLGRLESRQVLPAEVVQRSHEPVATVKRRFFQFQRDHYAMGWYVGTHLDQKMLHHFGSFPGTRAHVSFMPDRKMGVYAATNSDGAGFLVVDLIADYAYQWWLRPENLEARFVAKRKELAARSGKRWTKYAAKQKERAQLSLLLSQPLSAYMGRFENVAYGTVTIRTEDAGLMVRAGKMASRAEPAKEKDTIYLELIPGRGGLLSFELDEKGKVMGFRLDDVHYQRAASP